MQFLRHSFNMRYLSIFILIHLSITTGAQGLKVNGSRIINAAGNEVILRGFGLGGWMLQEPYMLDLSGAAVAQYDIRNKITDLIGKERTAAFYEAWLNNHCTKADIDSLAAWGFNSVRLPLHYNLFTLPVEEEPVKNRNTWLVKGFQLTDSLLSWCKTNHVYLILDLHAAPGGQGNDNAIADRDDSKPSLWQSEANKNKTIALWKKLAARYAGEEWIGGYDIINEPNWGFRDHADTHGCNEKENLALRKLYLDITAAIRKADKKHIIFIEGNCWANNYNGIFPLWDDNIVISFHKYWNYTTDGSIQNFLNLRDKYNVPLWMGETGENSNTWFTNVLMLLEKNRIGWNMWPLKKAGMNNPFQIKINSSAQKVIDYLKGNGSKPDASEAFSGLMQLAIDTKTGNNIFHRDVTDAMMRQVSETATIPFKQNIIETNTILFASDYDIGRAGIAYHDKDSAEYWVETSVRTPWNIGGQYRNDGVDIETCKDDITNGYNVGWIEAGEWMQYSLYVTGDEVFDVNVRYAAKDNAGRIRLILNDEFISEDQVLTPTGANQKWKTNTIKNIKLTKGWNRFRILATAGGFNLNYLQFLRSGNSVMSD